MSINPAGKLAKLQTARKRTADQREARRLKRDIREQANAIAAAALRSSVDHTQPVDGELVSDAASSDDLNHPRPSSLLENLTTSQSRAIAQIVVADSKSAIAQSIRQAREKLQRNADFYVDAHQAAVSGALATGDYDVARKGAEAMIEKISVRTADGSVERMIEPVEQSAGTGARIQIGIALGGLPGKQLALRGST